MRIVFLTHDKKYININTENLDFTDLEEGKDLIKWLVRNYGEKMYESLIIKDFRWSDEPFEKDCPYRYQEYIGYSFHGDTGGYAQWKD